MFTLAYDMGLTVDTDGVVQITNGGEVSYLPNRDFGRDREIVKRDGSRAQLLYRWQLVAGKWVGYPFQPREARFWPQDRPWQEDAYATTYVPLKLFPGGLYELRGIAPEGLGWENDKKSSLFFQIEPFASGARIRAIGKKAEMQRLCERGWWGHSYHTHDSDGAVLLRQAIELREQQELAQSRAERAAREQAEALAS